MPINHRWENTKQTIYIFCMEHDWTWQSFQEALRDGYESVRRVTHHVDMIYAYLSPLPSGNAIQYLMLASESQPENCHRSVLVDPHNVVRDMIHVVDTMNQWEGPKFVRTVEEALTYLRERDDA